MARTCPVKQKFHSIITLHIKYIPSYSIPERWIYPTNWFHHSLTYHNPIQIVVNPKWIWGLYWILLGYFPPLRKFTEGILGTPLKTYWIRNPGVILNNLYFNKHSRWFWWTRKFEKNQFKKITFPAVTYAIRTSK